MTNYTIGIADYKIGKQQDMLTTLGLGSCVGVVLYDPTAKIGGMVHIMLPTFNGLQGQNKLKFADTGIMELYNKLCMSGVRRTAIQAKMAGGAHMFAQANRTNVMRIGDNNVEACRQTLAKLRIPILAQDTGGSHGRTIELYTADGSLKIKTIGKGEKTI